MVEQIFVARKRELGQLQSFLDRALAGHGQACFVTGEAGAGKTALVTEFARRAQVQHDDLLVAIGDCNAQTGIGDPYLPFREILAQLTGDVDAGTLTDENTSRLQGFLRVSGQALVELGPDLIDVFVPGAGVATRAATMLAGKFGWTDQLQALKQRQAPEDSGLEQRHLFEQYANVLKAMAAQQPLILVIDDLQWADADSISLLFHLGRRIDESRILIVGTYRPDEVALGRNEKRHPLEKVVAEFKRYHGDVWLDLDQTKQLEGRQFVDAFLETEPNRLGETFRDALFRRTKGHPLFIRELLRAMQERGDLVQDEEGYWIEGPALDWDALPARVEGVIEERIGRLEDELLDILTVASVEGEDFTAQVVARVQELRKRHLLRALSRELEKRHRLVRERGEVQVDQHLLSRYRFAHALFQRYLYNDLSAGERRLLHGEIAEILEELYAGHTDEITVQLARHYTAAGDSAKATEYLLQAGDRARGLYAHQEAIDYYQRALEFLKEQGEYERAARTLMKLGLTYHTAFQFGAAREAYEEAFDLQQRARQFATAAVPAAPHPLRLSFGEPQTLDPGFCNDNASSVLIECLFSGLVDLTPELDVVPDVAQSWEVTEGGRTYAFHLRHDVRWTDGTPVTAHDFEYAWKRVLDPTTQAPQARMLYDIRDARAFHRGETSNADAVGVRAVDDVTLVVELEAPTAYFLYLLTRPALYPVPQRAGSRYGEAWTDLDRLLTNGPFRLESWQRGEAMVLVRNPEYYGRFAGNVERVELLLQDLSPSARLELYREDALDIVGLGRDTIHARQQHVDEYVTLPSSFVGFVEFDATRPPLDDPRVWRAFALATDKEAFAEVATGGLNFPATGGFVPPVVGGHSKSIGLPFQPEQARRLMAEAGFPEGHGFPVVQFLMAPMGVAHGNHLCAQWRDILGVEMQAEVPTTHWEYVNSVTSQQYPIQLGGWGGAYPDPDGYLRVGVHEIQPGWHHEEYEHLIEEARRTADHAQRMKLYQRADRILVEEGPILPLTYSQSHLLVKPWLRKSFMQTNEPTWKDVVIEPH